MADTPIGEVLLTDVRLSFAEIYKAGKPQKNDAGEMVPGKFRANGLISKTSKSGKANMEKLKKAADEVKAKKWGDKIPKLKADRVCVRDGDQEDWEGYAGHWYISANNPEKPVLITKFKDDNGKWIPAKEGVLYSGCYVNLLVRLWAQDHPDYGKRLNASLEAVQFVRKGEAFGGGGPIDAEDKFASIEADEGFNMGDDDEDEDDDVSDVI